ncbi:DASH complex subunit Dad2 [Rhizoctonia solani]|uniref:DASH complex subunit DAD2 n=1 Tax=Rhizoctonia solani TaxID=456999 RepID=A0A8H7IFP1_9AGAM|nr:DASH complex subunit Dad2 [Rhizoctonia solani]
MNRMSSLGQPRQSTIASGQGSSVAQQRYIDKKAEYEGVSALNAASELMVQQLEDIANRTDLMADGGVGACYRQLALSSNWPNVWRIIGLAASAGQGSGQDPDAQRPDDAGVETVPRLVRIEVNSSEAEPAPET